MRLGFFVSNNFTKLKITAEDLLWYIHFAVFYVRFVCHKKKFLKSGSRICIQGDVDWVGGPPAQAGGGPQEQAARPLPRSKVDDIIKPRRDCSLC